jgi:uncharacterized protein YdhG (YjbR/CyaY superfamily)
MVSGDAHSPEVSNMAEKRTATRKKSQAFTAEERAAMKERARETKASKGDGEADLLAKIAEMADQDRSVAERLHEIVRKSAPDLEPKTWYGMPAYARDGKVVCFFQPSAKFKTRYSTFGFNDRAKLDDGAMWPVAFAVTELTPDVEERIAALVKRAAS